MCFRFFRIAIIRVIFSCSYCRTINISLIILLASQVNYLEVRISLKRKVRLILVTVFCLWSIRLLSITNVIIFFPYWRFTTGMPCFWIHHSSHVINRCWQAASIIWNINRTVSTMTNKAEFIGGPTVLRCSMIISVFKSVFTRELRSLAWNNWAQSK